MNMIKSTAAVDKLLERLPDLASLLLERGMVCC